MSSEPARLATPTTVPSTTRSQGGNSPCSIEYLKNSSPARPSAIALTIAAARTPSSCSQSMRGRSGGGGGGTRAATGGGGAVGGGGVAVGDGDGGGTGRSGGIGGGIAVIDGVAAGHGVGGGTVCGATGTRDSLRDRCNSRSSASKRRLSSAVRQSAR